MNSHAHKRLKHSINFVVPDDLVWPELRGHDFVGLSEQKLSEYSVGSMNGWLLRTCYHLRSVGEWPTISATSVSNAINFFSPREFGRRNRNPMHFIAIPRADTHRPMLADFFFEQNPAFALSDKQTFLPYWPQADIIPRPQSRGARIEKISFKGRIHNIDAEYRSESFKAALSSRGVSLDIDGFNGLKGEHSWGDYQETDLVLAVRNLTVRDAAHKPASKLINAWFGAAPALLGPEPAFKAIRKSDLDYIEVTSPKSALSAIDRLMSSPELFMAMVENGLRRCEEYSVSRTIELWIDALNGPIGGAFAAWSRRSAAVKSAAFLAMLPCEKISKRYYQYYIRNGKRLIPGEPAKEY